MANIAFFRHAESTFNKFGDRSRNVPITPNGVSVSKQMVGNLDLVICSTMKRARQTLDESNLQYKRVIFTELCREILDGNESNYYSIEDIKIETPDDVKKRLNEFKIFILSQPEANLQDVNVAVISHGCFLGELIGESLINCGLSVKVLKM